jgi:protein involved in polysaccharide export with SLBB domain
MNVGVTVLGQVIVPGEYLVAKRSTVQGAITLAGGLTPRAKLDEIKLIRKKNDTTLTLPVNLYRFFIDGDPNLLPNLEDGDVVVVPGMPGSSDIKVIGEVRTPGTYQVFEGSNLLDALYLAGGPTDKAALGGIRLISPYKKQNREFKFNIDRLLQAKQTAGIPNIEAGDIVYVPRKKEFWRGLISVLRDMATIAWPIVMILYYSGAFDR